MIGGFCWILLFLFVPETFWDRTPRPKSRNTSKNGSRLSFFRQRVASHVSHMSTHFQPQSKNHSVSHQVDGSNDLQLEKTSTTRSAAESALRRPSQVHRHRGLHVGFAPEDNEGHDSNDKIEATQSLDGHVSPPSSPGAAAGTMPLRKVATRKLKRPL